MGRLAAPYPITRSEPQGGPLGVVGDVALGAGAGVLDIGAGVAALAGNVFDSQGARDAAELINYGADLVRQQQSEKSKRRMEASWIGEEGKPSAWSDPLGTLLVQGSSVAAPIVGTMLAPAAAPAMWAGQGLLQLHAETNREVSEASDIDLRAKYPSYAAAREANVPEARARADLQAVRAGIGPSAIATGQGALGGYAFGKMLAPPGVGRLRRAAVGGLEGTAGGAVSGTGYDIAKQSGEIAAGGQEEIDWGQAALAGANLAAMAGPVGTIAGAVSKRRGPKGDKSTVAPELAAALDEELHGVDPAVERGAGRRAPGPAEPPPIYGRPPRGGSRRPGTSLHEPTAGTWDFVSDPYATGGPSPVPRSADIFAPEGGPDPDALRAHGAGPMTAGRAETVAAGTKTGPAAMEPTKPSKAWRAREKELIVRGGPDNTGITPGTLPPDDGTGGAGGPPDAGGGGGGVPPAPVTPTAPAGTAAAPEAGLEALPTVPTRGPTTPAFMPAGPAIWTTNSGQHVIVLITDAEPIKRDGQMYRTVETEDGNTHTLPADQLSDFASNVPDWVREQGRETVMRWLANLPARLPSAEPPGPRVFGAPETRAEGAADYSYPETAPPTAADITNVPPPPPRGAAASAQVFIEERVKELEAEVERLQQGGALPELRKRFGETAEQIAEYQRQRSEHLADLQRELAEARVELRGARPPGLPPVHDPRRPSPLPQPSTKLDLLPNGEMENPLTGVQYLKVGDRVQGPEGDTMVITDVTPGTDNLITFQWQGDARGAEPGTIRASALARVMETHEAVDTMTGVPHMVPAAKVIPARLGPRPTTRTFGPKEPLARATAASDDVTGSIRSYDLRQLSPEREGAPPPLRPGPSQEAGVPFTPEQEWARERPLPRRTRFYSKAEQAKKVAKELQNKEPITQEEARRVARTEVLRNPTISKRAQVYEIERLTRELLAGNIDLDRLQGREAEPPRPGETLQQRRERLNIVLDELPPKPGSPEDLARQRESETRPATERERGGREAVPTRRLPDEAHGPERPTMVHGTVDVEARRRAVAARVDAAVEKMKEEREATEKTRRKGAEAERQITMRDKVEEAARKVFRQAKDVMKSFTQTNFWEAISPTVTEIKVPKRVKGGAAAREADLAAKDELRREERRKLRELQEKREGHVTPREKLMAQAKEIVEALRKAMGGDAYTKFIMVKKTRRTAAEMAAGKVSAYPNRYLARLLHNLVIAEAGVKEQMKRGGFPDRSVKDPSKARYLSENEVMDQHFRTFREGWDKLKEQQEIIIDTRDMTPAQRAAAEAKMAEMTPEQRAAHEATMTAEQLAQDVAARERLEDEGVGLPQTKEAIKLDNDIELQEKLVEAREDQWRTANVMIDKAKRDLDNLLARDRSKLASKFKQEADDVVAARKALDDAHTKVLDIGEKLQDALDRLDRLKAKRSADINVRMGAEKKVSPQEAYDELTGGGGSTGISVTKRQSRIGAPEKRQPEPVKQYSAEDRARMQKQYEKEEASRALARLQTLVKRRLVADDEGNVIEPPNAAELTERYGERGKDETVESTATVEVDRAISDIRGHANEEYTPQARIKAHAVADLIEAIMRKFQAVLGNTPVRVVDQTTLDQVFPGGRPAGVFHGYTPGTLAGGERGVMWLSRESMTGFDGPHTVTHETGHAATHHALDSNTGITQDVADLGRHVQAHLDQHPEAVRRYGLTEQDVRELNSLNDPHEMVAVANSNGRLQRAMIEIGAPADIRAKYGLAKDASVWDGFINAIARLFNLRRAEYSVLDAMLSINEQLLAYVPPRMDVTADTLTRSAKYARRFHDPNVSFHALMGVDTAKIVKKLTDTSLNTRDLLGRAYRSLASTRSIGETARSFFKPIADDERGRSHFDLAIERLERMGTEAQSIFENQWLPVGEAAAKLKAKYEKGEWWLKWQEFVIDETMAQVYGDRSLADQTKHPTVKGMPKPDNRGRHLSADVNAYADAQKRANWQEMNDRWNELKAAAPDLAAFHQKFRDEVLPQDSRMMAREHLRNLLDITRETGAPRMDDGAAYALVDRMLDDTMTEAEKATYGSRSLLKLAVRDSRALARVGGPWAPLMRIGDHVVQGHYNFDPMGGKRFDSNGNETPDGTYFRFDSEPARRAFDIANRAHKTTEHRTIYFNKADGKRITDTDEGKKAFDAGTADAKYQLHIQDKLVEYHETRAEAVDSQRELRRQIDEDGLNLTLLGSEPRRWEKTDKATSFLDNEYQRALRELEQTPQWESMGENQRSTLRNIVQDIGLRALGPTRVRSKSQKRRYVAGASTDFMGNLGRYASSSAGYRSHLTHFRHINRHLSELRKEVRENPYEKDEISHPRQGLLNELHRRADVRDMNARTTFQAAAHKGVQRLLQLTNAAKLGTPAYHITNLLEPDMVAGPLLDARFGFGSASREFRRAERAMGAGATLAQGLKETGTAIIHGPQRKDFNKPIIDRLRTETDGAELAGMIEEAVERGHIQRSGVMEFYHLATPSESKVGKFIDYADNISRQMTLADEAVNRTKVLVASYRLAREKGKMSVEQAKQFAFDTNLKSMGDYSEWNTAPFFRQDWVKPAAQFKKYGMKTYELLGHLIKDTLDRTKTNEERVIAAKAFGHVLMRHALMAGVGGLPLEPIRLAMIVGGVVGFKYSYEDMMNDMRQAAANVFGKDVGQIWAGGLPRYFGLDFSNRLNLDQLISPFDPKSTKPEDYKTYLSNMILGAGGDQAINYVRGIQALGQGKYYDFVGYLAPLKPIHDVTVAIQNIMTSGDLTPSGKRKASAPDFWDTVSTIGGFRSGRMAEEGDYRNRLLREKSKRHGERIEITQDYVNATDRAGRDAAWKQAMDYNRDKPGHERITRGNLEKSRQSRNKANREDEFGVSLGRSDESLRGLRQYYNVGP